MPEANHNELLAALGPINPISLDEMDGVKLLNRIDTKYLCNEDMLLGVLHDAALAGYRALCIEGHKISPYNSIYYDTQGLSMYLAHHNRRAVRQKVRTREYLLSGEAYLEIKHKNNKGRTKKKRTHISASDMGDFHSDKAAVDYLESHCGYAADDLSPVLSTAFERITLVNSGLSERLTIDTSLTFNNFRNRNKASLSDAVIIELKQEGYSSSQMKAILHNNGVKPMRISKYCIAECLTDPMVKHNRFKAKIMAIQKIINHNIIVI